MAQHSILSPSSSHRWIRCPGSKHGRSGDTSPAAEEGTRLHEVAYTHDLATTTEGLPDKVKAFLDFLVETEGELQRELTLESIRLPEFFGTADAIITTEDEIYVVDLKTGNTHVPAKDNYQLQCYLCIAREHFPDKKKFYGVIVQDGVDATSFTAKQLDKFWRRIEKAATSNYRAAGSHCQYCPLLKSCDTAKEWVVSLGSTMFCDVSSEMSVKECKQLIELGPVASELADLAKAALTSKLMRGEKVDGWRLGVPMSNRYWKDELIAAAVLSDLAGDREIYQKSLLTPAKAEAMLGKWAIAPFTARDAKDPIAVLETSKLIAYTPTEELFQEGGDE